jgi:hypothetical protein
MQYLKESIDNDLIAEMAECSKEDLFRWRALSKYPSDLPEYCSLIFPTGQIAELRFFEVISSALDRIFDEEVEEERKLEDYGQLLHVETREYLDHALDVIEKSPITFEDTLTSTWVSSSDCVACDQIDHPKDHVHFEEYNDMKEYLNNVTDVEKVWFENKCMDVTQVGEEEWKTKKFFNLKSMVHYVKWGKFVEHYVSRCTPKKKMREVMENYYFQGKVREANFILSSTLLGHDPPFYSNAMRVECDSSIQHYRPYGVGTLVEVFSGESPGVVSFHTRLIGGTVQRGSLKNDFPQSLLATPTLYKDTWKRANPHVRMKAYDKHVSFPFTAHYEDNNPWKEKQEEKDQVRKVVNDLMGLVHLTKVPDGDILVMGRPLWVTEEKAVFFQQSVPYITVMMERWMKKKRDRYPPYCIYPRKRNGMVVWSMVHPLQLIIFREIVEITSTEEIPIQILRRLCSCQQESSLSFCRTHGAVLDMGGLTVSAFCGPFLGDVIHIPEVTPFLRTEISITSSERKEWTESVGGEHVIQYLDTEAHFFSWPNVLPIGCPSIGYRCDQVDLLLYCQSSKGSNVVNGYIGTSAYQEWNLPIDLFMVIPNVIGEMCLFHNVLFWILTIENRLSRREIERMRGEGKDLVKKIKVKSSIPKVRSPPKYVCNACLERKTRAGFSLSQIKKGDLRKCKNCVDELLQGNCAADPPQKYW